MSTKTIAVNRRITGGDILQGLESMKPLAEADAQKFLEVILENRIGVT